MTKIARFSGDLQAFGSAATGTERTVFGDVAQSDTLDANINTDFLAGWENGLDVNDFPPQQYFNAVGFTATQLAAYLHQMGIAEYDAVQEYHIGSLANVTGNVYKSLTNDNIGNAVTDTTNWQLIAGFVSKVSITGAYGGSLTAAIADIGANETTLLIDSIVTLTQADVVPDNITLEKTREGKFTGSFLLTIHGQMTGDLMSQWFDSSVTVAGTLNAETITSQMFYDGLGDYSAALIAVGALGRSVYFPDGTYNANDVTLPEDNTVFYSAGNAIIKFNGTNGQNRLIRISGDDTIMLDMIFDGNGEQPEGTLVSVLADTTRPKILGCKFQNIYGSEVGSVVLNAKYALAISADNVQDFKVLDCMFFDLTTINNDTTFPEGQGLGFVGGIIFAEDDITSPAIEPTIFSSGKISRCLFDTIKTLIKVGSSKAIYDDADAIRFLGSATYDMDIVIEDIVFKDVSKRAIKASVPGVTMKNIDIYDPTIGMVSGIKIHPGCSVDGLNYYGNVTTPVQSLIQHEQPDTLDYTNIKINNIQGKHVDRFYEFAPSSATAIINNLVIENITIDQLTDQGFAFSANTNADPSGNFFVRNITLIGDNSGMRAYQLRHMNIDGMNVINGEVHHGGTNIAKNIKISFTDGANYTPFDSTNAIADLSNLIENIEIDVRDIPNTFLTATKVRLIYIRDDFTKIKNLTLRTNTDFDAVAYALMDISAGNRMVINGLDHIGTPGQLYIGRGGATVSYLSIFNATRLSSDSAKEFFYLDSIDADQIIFRNIDDFANVGADVTLNNSAGGSSIYAAGISSRSSTAATANFTTVTDEITLP
ncbi:hypothetical protein KAR91_75680 [Candidatus Pacearchaeota archaeon]|nr:hypothetical protein [Candidatus Pacearchaeota archaeon]